MERPMYTCGVCFVSIAVQSSFAGMLPGQIYQFREMHNVDYSCVRWMRILIVCRCCYCFLGYFNVCTGLYCVRRQCLSFQSLQFRWSDRVFFTPAIRYYECAICLNHLARFEGRGMNELETRTAVFTGVVNVYMGAPMFESIGFLHVTLNCRSCYSIVGQRRISLNDGLTEDTLSMVALRLVLPTQSIVDRQEFSCSICHVSVAGTYICVDGSSLVFRHMYQVTGSAAIGTFVFVSCLVCNHFLGIRRIGWDIWNPFVFPGLYFIRYDGLYQRAIQMIWGARHIFEADTYFFQCAICFNHVVSLHGMMEIIPPSHQSLSVETAYFIGVRNCYLGSPFCSIAAIWPSAIVGRNGGGWCLHIYCRACRTCLGMRIVSFHEPPVARSYDYLYMSMLHLHDP